MLSAQYVSLVTRACPGLFSSIQSSSSAAPLCCCSEFYIRYHLPQERGWAYAHTLMLAEGIPTVWPRREDNKDGRWWGWLVKGIKALRHQASSLPLTY